MANQSEKYIQGAVLQGGGIPNGAIANTPQQYINRQHQYFASPTTQFIKERAVYSSDFVKADVQGISPDDFYKYTTTYIRFSDVASQTASSTNNVDDIKVILFQERTIDYFPIGAKIQTMGSTWICTNPSNISSVHSTALVKRCNAAYCLYDYYGNIVTEPIVVEKYAMQSNDNGTPENLVMMEGYFNVTCQLNENTRFLGQNQRIILGSKAYHITGFTDFIQEFTGDYDSVHLLKFTIRIEEPTDDDDLINHIANGNAQTFSAQIIGADKLNAGSMTQLTANFIKNGQAVSASEEYPLTWEWTSSSPDIASVDESGMVTAKTAGNVSITAVLSQSTGITASLDLSIEEAQTQPYMAFTSLVPSAIRQYMSATISAAYFEDGAETDEAVAWTFAGAEESSYYTNIDGNSVTITCAHPDDVPLTVTATCNGESVSAQIALEGY